MTRRYLRIIPVLSLAAFLTFAFAAKAGNPSIRSQFTSFVENSEPIDRIESLPYATKDIYYFTELRGFKGATVLHSWTLNGSRRAVVEIKVKASRWRFYSKKSLRGYLPGKWTVSLIDKNTGIVLRDESFLHDN